MCEILKFLNLFIIKYCLLVSTFKLTVNILSTAINYMQSFCDEVHSKSLGPSPGITCLMWCDAKHTENLIPKYSLHKERSKRRGLEIT